ncbi:spermidine synthase [Aureococcus anophagefferens]|uniref:Spermidine synthase n=1 Tax=Aureococcus anophagefferens TaxID=44056 RepID=A0ABR1FL94_AURAN
MGGCSTKAAMPDEPAEPAAPVPEAIVALGVGARVASATNDQRQALEIWETREAGRVLVVDGAVRLSEADERPYHEMLSHVAVCAAAARKRRRGLVPGLDVLARAARFGAARRARELRQARAPSVVKSIAVVDVDGVASNFVATHLPALDAAKMRAELGAASNPSTSGDALGVLVRRGARARRRFDVVILDADAGNPLDAKEIDVAVKAVLSDGASPARERAAATSWTTRGGAAACDVFEDVRVFSWLMPTLKGGHCKAVLLGREPFGARTSRAPRGRNFLLRSPEAAVPARPADGADFSIFGCAALGADALCKTDDFARPSPSRPSTSTTARREAEDDWAMMRKLSGNHETKAAREKPSTRAAPEPAFAGPVCAARAAARCQRPTSLPLPNGLLKKPEAPSHPRVTAQ